MGTTVLSANLRLPSSTLIYDSGVAFVLDIFCNETVSELRVRAAELLTRMAADRLVGGKVRIQLNKFLPPLFADAMRDAPSTAVQLYETSSENPELIWTDDMRMRLSAVCSAQECHSPCDSNECFVFQKVVHRITQRQLAVITQDPQAEWVGIDPQDESELPNLDAEISVGGIYLRLLVANPGWVLRKPKEIVGELIEAGLQGLQKEAVRTNRLLSLLH